MEGLDGDNGGDASVFSRCFEFYLKAGRFLTRPALLICSESEEISIGEIRDKISDEVILKS